jgi:hypothetical protein
MVEKTPEKFVATTITFILAELFMVVGTLVFIIYRKSPIIQASLVEVTLVGNLFYILYVVNIYINSNFENVIHPNQKNDCFILFFEIDLLNLRLASISNDYSIWKLLSSQELEIICCHCHWLDNI